LQSVLVGWHFGKSQIDRRATEDLAEIAGLKARAGALAVRDESVQVRKLEVGRAIAAIKGSDKREKRSE